VSNCSSLAKSEEVIDKGAGAIGFRAYFLLG
jgi:hypothetical protein